MTWAKSASWFRGCKPIYWVHSRTRWKHSEVHVCAGVNCQLGKFRLLNYHFMSAFSSRPEIDGSDKSLPSSDLGIEWGWGLTHTCTHTHTPHTLTHPGHCWNTPGGIPGLLGTEYGNHWLVINCSLQPISKRCGAWAAKTKTKKQHDKEICSKNS